MKSSLKPYVLPPFKMSLVDSKQKAAGGSQLKTIRYAYKFDVDYSIGQHGRWDTLVDGRRVWRLAVLSEGAFSLGIAFSKFKLPKGGQLFVYNNQSGRILGAYTEKNNKPWGKFAVEPLGGDELILEYVEPPNPDFQAELEIDGILHDYKNIFALFQGGSSVKVGESGSCNVDINCPEGDEWQIEKRAVCQIVTNGWLSSGALINNTAFDGRALFLTAHHAIGEEAEANSSIFYFNYENSDCGLQDASGSQTISGATLLSTAHSLDFSLLELSQVPPFSFLPFYAGWDNSGRVPANTTCIHHPSGDAKKISIDYDSPVTATYCCDIIGIDANVHWRILEWDVGTTEGGSSGSPLFDENHRIIGDLTGGEASCFNSVNDFYAKFSEGWDNYPDPNEQLKYWLDPLNLGYEVLDGYDPFAELRADFKTSADTICISSQLTLTDRSFGDPDSYFWDFGESASPDISSEKGPHTVSYSNAGSKEVKLVVTEGEERDSLTKEILVVDPPVANFDFTLEHKTVSMTDSSENVFVYAWDFGDGATSDIANPFHTYSLQGNYTVILSVENVCGSNSQTMEIKTRYNDQLKIYPNPSSRTFAIDLSKITYSKINWSIWDSGGSKVKEGFVSSPANIIDFNLIGLSPGIYIIKLDVDGEVLKRKLLLVR